MALIPGVPNKVLTLAVLFFIIGNPMTYRLVDTLLGGLVGRIASVSGSPTTLGLIVHSIVFAAVAVYVVRV
jgi:hypothetical protein